ncbi:hypothetical protein DSECCO2_250580 [anaerobic digester metagenome]
MRVPACSAIQRQNDFRLNAELVHDRLAVGKKGCKVGGHGADLTLGGVLGVSIQRDAENVQHQQCADEQGNDADGEKSAQQLLPERKVLHDASPAVNSVQWETNSSFNSAAQRTG